MPIHEIRVTPIGSDPLGRDVQQEAARALGEHGIVAVNTAKVYRLEGISDEEANKLAQQVLADPVSERFNIDSPIDYGTDNVVEVAYEPGVMNPEADSIMKAAADIGIHPKAADSSREYAFKGQLTPSQVERVVGGLLVNKTVQHVVKEPPKTLTFEGSVGPITIVPIRQASPKDLMELSKDKLFLDETEMSIVQKHFRKLKRDPTDAELEIIAARWSEHCGHKTFNAKVIRDGREKTPFFQRIKEKAQEHFNDRVVSAFSDNSGVIKFYDGWAISGKVETHNSPSAVEPYGGAMTGTGGCIRDIIATAQGAKTTVSTDMFCFASPKMSHTKLPAGTLPPDYLQRRVVQGVRDYGNRMGIPTANGSLHFHDDFRAKPSVIVGAYGILPEARAKQGKAEVHDLVVAFGGRTGRDGIHGATFSSGEMTEHTASVNSSAVQIGNAIEEKRLSDAILEARDLDCIRAITDCGAAGFSSAVVEMAEHIGVTVDISKAPLKYPGLAPWEIWLSESQERMVAAIPPEKIEEFLATCTKYNVEATVLGEFDGSHTLTVNYADQNVAELDYEFLNDGLPQRVMEAAWQPTRIETIKPTTPENEQEWIDRLKAVLSHGDICSKEPIVRQYDHGVQGGNVVAPYGGSTQSGPNDALVIRPLLDKPYGMVQSHGMNPKLNRLSPYLGTAWAVAEAVANYASVGGDPENMAMVGNYITAYPDAETMGMLDDMVDAAVDMMDVTGAPVISGKDSLSSTYRGKDGEVIKIPPVYCASAFGGIEDVERTMTSDLKGDGSLYLVGNLSSSMGGSAYYEVSGGESSEVPDVDFLRLMSQAQAVHQAIADGALTACHDISEGGLVSAVAEMCFGNDVGAQLYMQPKADPEVFLYSETAGSYIVEVPHGVQAEDLFGELPHTCIGFSTTDTSELSVTVKDESHDKYNHDVQLFRVPIAELKGAWQAPMQELFHA